MTLNEFKKTLPRFSDISVAQIEEKLDELLSRNLAHINELVNQKVFTWDHLIRPMEDDGDYLHKFWSPISHLNAVMNNEALRDVYEACLPKLTEYGTQIAHNKKLYEAVQSIADSEDYKNLDSAQQKVIAHHLRDFKLSGVALNTDQKKRFTEISMQLSELANTFENNVLDATKAWTKQILDEKALSGIPDLMRQQFRLTAEQRKQEGWVITLEMPSYLAVMMHADDRELRRELYEAYTTRASDTNTQVMDDIMKYRLELAKLLGFSNYAEKSLATKMVHDTQQVLGFLNDLVTATLSTAREEFKELSRFAASTVNIDTVAAWDVSYLSEKLRAARYAISEEELRPYFPIEQVMTGLFAIIYKLFDVTVKPLTEVDTWHPDVKAYALFDENDEVIAAVYTDLYARTNKRGGAWMDEYQVRRRIDTHTQLPIAYVNCNFAGPVNDTPALLQHDDVVTLFHEFGHALQHMLTKVDYADVSGINGIPWDAVEIASQFLENWAWQQESMPMISKHYQTGKSLPDDLFEKMNRAKNFQSAMTMVRQLEFALFDFELHILFNDHEKNQIQTILDAVRKRINLVPVPAFNRFQHSFSHIFAGGYDAGYYSYKWAEVMAADAFSVFLEKGIFDHTTSKLFQETFLESGGAKEPADLFQEFRGRAPQVTALLTQSGIK